MHKKKKNLEIAFKLPVFCAPFVLFHYLEWSENVCICSILLNNTLCILLGEGGFVKEKIIKLLKYLGMKMVPLILTDCDGLWTPMGAEG